MIGPSVNKFVRRMGLIGALLIGLNSGVQAWAVEVPVQFNFGTAPSCNITSWTTEGDVSALTEAQAGLSASSNCVASVHSIVGTSSGLSVLKRDFVVPEHGRELMFDIWAYSDYTAHSYPAQSIRLIAANGTTIYHKYRNTSTSTYFYYLFPEAYIGQAVTLEIATYADYEDLYSPQESFLYIDNVRFEYTQNPEPETTPGGGW
jgi:hypothetical protein